jgi:hypothetical protein
VTETVLENARGAAVMCGRGIEFDETGDGTDQGILSGVLE